MSYKRVADTNSRRKMKQYRIYCLNNEGRFSKVREIEAQSDDEALALAREMQQNYACEVWQRHRLVGKVVAQSAA